MVCDPTISDMFKLCIQKYTALFAKLPMKLVPLKVSATLSIEPIAPPTYAELWLKLLVPLKLNDVLALA